MGYFLIVATVILTVYGQLIIKWRINNLGPVPYLLMPKMISLISNIFDVYIFSGLLSAFIALILWMAALTKFELNYAYPFMSFSFIIVSIESKYILGEQFG
jgi:hypothetical protein